MYFDFEDYRPDAPRVDQALSTREGVLLSIIVHAAVIAAVLLAPPLPGGRRAFEDAQQVVVPARQPDAPRFVFVRPRVDLRAPKAPKQAPDSDRDRRAQAPERAERPSNPLPFSRGNSPQQVESDLGPRAEVPDSVPPREARVLQAQPEGAMSRPPVTLPDAAAGQIARANPDRPNISGPLGDALRNLQRYVERESFDNPQGGASVFGPSIQFDTKGVEFGPWIRRFVAQIKRNWFIPYAAMAMRGHVVVTFNVHKDGSITDLAVVGPSSVDAFNHAAYNAMAMSNPTQPLPPEYPSNRAAFTVTFYYNETPPLQ